MKLKLNNARILYFFISKLYGTFLRMSNNVFNLPPLRYTFFPTTKCNFKCTYCHVSSGLNQEPEDVLTLEEWKKIASNVSPFSVVSFTGGEPLLYKDLEEIIKAVKKKKGVVTIVTNGSLLTEPRIDALYASGVNYLMISVDGHADDHDQSRGAPGSFSKINKALDYIEEKYGENFSIGLKVVLTESSLRSFDSLVSFASGYSCIRDIAVNLIYQSEQNGALYSDDKLQNLLKFNRGSFGYTDELKDKIRGLIKNFDEFKKIKPLSFTLKVKEGKILDYIDQPNSFGVKSCTLPWTDISVLSNGDITSCLNFKLGTIRALNYRIGYTSKLPSARTFWSFIKKHSFLEACRGCPLTHCHERKGQN